MIGEAVIASGYVDFPDGKVRIKATIQHAASATVVVTGGTIDRSGKPPKSCADVRVHWGRPGPKLKLKRTGSTEWAVETTNRRVGRATASEMQRFVFTASNGAGSTVRTMVKNTLCG